MCNEKIYYIISYDINLVLDCQLKQGEKRRKLPPICQCILSCHIGETHYRLWKHSCFVSVSKGEHTRQALNKQQWSSHGKVHK